MSDIVVDRQGRARGRLYAAWFHWRHGWYWWHVERHLRRDAIEQRIAFLLPRRIALWAFIRVYAHGVDAPGEEYARIYDAWEKR